MECLDPFRKANPVTGEVINLRCRVCYSCRLHRAGEWTIRLVHHERDCKHNYFVTLTYNDDNIIWGNGLPTLYKRDVQLFMKRIRKDFGDQRLSYYAVGEYGSQTKRPHYHLILFNTGIDSKEAIEHITALSWDKGFTHVGKVTPASIRYVAGYIEKGYNGEFTEDTIQREFSLMSKGIGSNYIQRNGAFHLLNDKWTVTQGGKELPIPEYYKHKIFSEEKRSDYAQKIAEQAKKRIEQAGGSDKIIEAVKARITAKSNLKRKRK